jgi:transcriptional regulator with XRE-family HTH domain
MVFMVGEKLREARVAQRLSLAEVAGRAHVSAATLSRIERDKQALDVGLFLVLAEVLRTAPVELLDPHDEAGDRTDPLVTRLASMQTKERTDMWKELTAERLDQRQRGHRSVRVVAQEVEELLAQIDFLRGEVEAVRSRLGRGRR